MWQLWSKLSILGLVFAFLSSPTKADEKYTLSLNWIPHSLHFGIYLAKERGWYHDAGLDIAIERGYGSSDTVKRVGTGASDFGLADTASVVLGRASGINTKLVAMLMNRPADAIYFVKGSGIKTPKDLEGKTMGAAVGEASLPLMPMFAKLAGFDLKKVEYVMMASPSKIPSLAQKKVDSIMTYTNEEPMVKNAGRMANVEIDRFLFADYGVDYYSVGIIVSDKMLQTKPQAIKDFVDVTMRGYAEAFSNPNEAIDAFSKSNPESSRDLMQQQWSTLRANMLTPAAGDKGLGYIDDAKMVGTLNLLRDYQNLKTDIKPADVYTMDYLSRIIVKQ